VITANWPFFGKSLHATTFCRLVAPFSACSEALARLVVAECPPASTSDEPPPPYGGGAETKALVSWPASSLSPSSGAAAAAAAVPSNPLSKLTRRRAAYWLPAVSCVSPRIDRVSLRRGRPGLGSRVTGGFLADQIPMPLEEEVVERSPDSLGWFQRRIAVRTLF
jgi:hypothetical protein